MYRDYIALEDLQNYSICVVESENKVREMKYPEDVTKELIYVDNIPLVGEDNSIVKEGKLIRGFRVAIVKPFER